MTEYVSGYGTSTSPCQSSARPAAGCSYGVGLVAALVAAPVLIMTAARRDGTVKQVGQKRSVAQPAQEDRLRLNRTWLFGGFLRKILFIFYQPYKWLIYVPFLIVSTLVFGTIATILSMLINQKIGSFIGGAVWARLNGYMTPIFVKVIGKENIDKNQSYVIVANHQSHFDVFVLYGWVGIDFKWVLKQELRKIPGLGIGCEKVGHIFIDRSNPQKAITSINAAKQKIVNGTSVAFFPEGTRGTSEKMGDFKKGAFIFAIETGVPLLPVTIINTGNILPPHTLNLLPGWAKMIIHRKIDVTGYTAQNIDELMSKARNAILAGLDEYS